MLSALSSVFATSSVTLYGTGVRTEAETTDGLTKVAATGLRFVPPVRGCYTPPPMGYRTPRVVCSY